MARKKASPIIPLAAVIAVGAGVFFLSRKSQAKDPLGPLPIVWDDGSWDLADGFKKALNAKLGVLYPNGPALPYDPLAISYAVLADEVPAELGYPSAPRAPDDTNWQADVPGTVSYFDGPESVLGLIHHVAEMVSF